MNQNRIRVHQKLLQGNPQYQTKQNPDTYLIDPRIALLLSLAATVCKLRLEPQLKISKRISDAAKFYNIIIKD